MQCTVICIVHGFNVNLNVFESLRNIFSFLFYWLVPNFRKIYCIVFCWHLNSMGHVTLDLGQDMFYKQKKSKMISLSQATITAFMWNVM